MIECALFDLDETLTRRDTTRMWLAAFVRRFPLRALRSAPHVLGVRRAAARPEDLQDAKFRMYGSLLRGLVPGDLVPVHQRYARAVRQVRRDVAWRAMEGHLNASRRVLVVTASLRSAVEHVFEGSGVETLGTEFETEEGVFTGTLDGDGCFGVGKVAAIAAWAGQQAQRVRFVDAWSDSLTDAPMMRMAERRHWLCPPASRDLVLSQDADALIVGQGGLG